LYHQQFLAVEAYPPHNPVKSMPLVTFSKTSAFHNREEQFPPESTLPSPEEEV
jgi:hypothetical protein